MERERLLTAADAARLLGVVPATVRVMALTGRLRPVAMTESGMRLFRRTDVECLVEERKTAVGRVTGAEQEKRT